MRSLATNVPIIARCAPSHGGYAAALTSTVGAVVSLDGCSKGGPSASEVPAEIQADYDAKDTKDRRSPERPHVRFSGLDTPGRSKRQARPRSRWLRESHVAPATHAVKNGAFVVAHYLVDQVGEANPREPTARSLWRIRRISN